MTAPRRCQLPYVHPGTTCLRDSEYVCSVCAAEVRALRRVYRAAEAYRKGYDEDLDPWDNFETLCAALDAVKGKR